MASAARALGWSLLLLALVGVLWPERPELPPAEGIRAPFQGASFEAPPPRSPPPRPPGGGCPTPTCFPGLTTLPPGL